MIQVESDLVPDAWEDNGVLMSSLAGPADRLQAKAMLEILHREVPWVGWHLEMKNDRIHVWSSLHATYGLLCKQSQLGKGYGKIGPLGRGLVLRIMAGAA